MAKCVLDLNVEQKTFKNANGDSINYFELSTIIKGKKIKLKVDSQDKSLFNYLIEDELD